MSLTATSTGRTKSEASQFVILPSAARTAAPDPAVYSYENLGNASGLRLYINTTAATSTPSTTVAIAFIDYKTSSYFDVLTSAAITATGKVILEIYPGATTVTNLTLGRVIGRGVRITFAHGNSNSHTYSVTGEWLP